MSCTIWLAGAEVSSQIHRVVWWQTNKYRRTTFEAGSGYARTECRCMGVTAECAIIIRWVACGGSRNSPGAQMSDIRSEDRSGP